MNQNRVCPDMNYSISDGDRYSVCEGCLSAPVQFRSHEEELHTEIQGGIHIVLVFSNWCANLM